MCKCTPEVKTPFCGKPGCEWPIIGVDMARGRDRTVVSFDTRVKLVQVVIGMAKEAGYDLDRFILEVRTGWPHVK